MFIKNLLIMALLSVGGSGCAQTPQMGKGIIDLENIDYGIDVPYYYSSGIDTDNITEENYVSMAEEMKKNPFAFSVDTLKAIDLENDQPYPSVLEYSCAGWDGSTGAVFNGYNFSMISMVTTEDNRLIAISARMIKSNYDVIDKAREKYGQPIKFDNSSSSVEWYRWEISDRFIQITKSLSGIKIHCWHKNDHKLMLIHDPCEFEHDWKEIDFEVRKDY